jgi:hypothetical protein
MLCLSPSLIKCEDVGLPQCERCKRRQLPMVISLGYTKPLLFYQIMFRLGWWP